MRSIHLTLAAAAFCAAAPCLAIQIPSASTVEGTLDTAGLNQGIQIALPCNPVSVTNGTVNATTCAITCNSGYSKSGATCVRQSSGGGGGGGGGSYTGTGSGGSAYLTLEQAIAAALRDATSTSVVSGTGFTMVGPNLSNGQKDSIIKLIARKLLPILRRHVATDPAAVRAAVIGFNKLALGFSLMERFHPAEGFAMAKTGVLELIAALRAMRAIK